MFGYVNVNWQDITPEQKTRYGSVYCGVCRRIREQSGNMARLGLQYDSAFLALLLMSLYEPEEISGPNACMLHPIRKRPWVDSDCIRYAADMNVALAYYKCLDDSIDEGKFLAGKMAKVFEKNMPRIEREYPRQCRAMETCLTHLAELERERRPNPDDYANSFGLLMEELMIFRQDHWERDLRRLGFHLGRFIYLLDAAEDFEKDKKHGRFNPYLAMGMENPDWDRWEAYLILDMARCTESYERLPLVQDKDILDNILYSGVWTLYKGKKKEEAKGS